MHNLQDASIILSCCLRTCDFFMYRTIQDMCLRHTHTLSIGRLFLGAPRCPNASSSSATFGIVLSGPCVFLANPRPFPNHQNKHTVLRGHNFVASKQYGRSLGVSARTGKRLAGDGRNYRPKEAIPLTMLWGKGSLWSAAPAIISMLSIDNKRCPASCPSHAYRGSMAGSVAQFTFTRSTLALLMWFQ